MKCSSRKPPRRRGQKPPVLDQGLADLAAVLAEYSLDNNAYGWFKLPWRDGWNAINLAREVGDATNTSMWLDDVVRARTLEPSLYWAAEEQLVDVVNLSPEHRAALRCLQVLVANSSGGGHAYNAILIPAFLHADPVQVADSILEHRCRDSIGTTAEFKGDANDRQRAAFRIAWERGLYLAAYSLPPAIDIKGRLTVMKGAT